MPEKSKATMDTAEVCSIVAAIEAEIGLVEAAIGLVAVHDTFNDLNNDRNEM